MRAAIAHIGTVSFPDWDIISVFPSARFLQSWSFLCFEVSIARGRVLSARTGVIVSVPERAPGTDGDLGVPPDDCLGQTGEDCRCL